MRDPHFFQNCGNFQYSVSWHQNKVSWCYAENDHNFERYGDRATVFLKWTDFTSALLDKNCSTQHWQKCNFCSKIEVKLITVMKALIEFDLFSWLFSGLDAWQCWHWQIKNKKLINKGTGREYSYDPSKKGYDLGNGIIIEERYIEDYQKNGPDKWEFCHEDDETFKIKYTSSSSFLRAKSDNGENHIIKGNFSFLLIK